MAFNTVGIQDNLPVQPVHVLQIIESLTFSGTYAAEDFYRQGRTNFGASAFTSSAHVEMHSYGGDDPLVVYGGPADSIQTFKVNAAGDTTAVSLVSTTASISTGSIGRATLTTAIIANETVSSAAITTATITNATVSNGVITTLNSTVGAITTFTASNAQVTNTATIATANVTNLTATNANLTGSLLGTASYANNAVSASYAVTASHSGTSITASFITGSGVVGTVSNATNAVTASYALTSAAGGPGGGQGQVQYFSASAFAGLSTLTYDGTTLRATGSFQGNLEGTASFVNLVQGPGIFVNGLAVTASVRTVNGISPVNGNVAVSLAGVLTGLSSSNYDINLVASSSGAITASFSDGALWVVSAETGSATSGSNGQVFIYKSGSVGSWLRVAPLDTAAADARYLLLAGGTMGGAINMGGFNATNAGTWQGTAYTASFVTASNVYGPYGASSVLTSSYAETSSFAVSASWAPTPGLNAAVLINTGSISTTQAITGSLRVTGSLGVTGSVYTTYGDISNPNKIGTPRINTSRVYPIGNSALYTRNYDSDTFDGSNSYYQSMFPIVNSYFIGTVSNSSGGFTLVRDLGHLGIGNLAYDFNSGTKKFESIFLHSQQLTGPIAPTTVATGKVSVIISDNNTIDDTGNYNTIASGIYTANGRAHVLSVTGSMLARDGVSIGTNITNQHYITGSVNMTGSFTLNGTNLATLVSPVQSVTVNLSQSDILSLGTSPIIILPAPGAGSVYDIVDTVIIYDYNSAPYTTATDLSFFHGTLGVYSTTGNFLTAAADTYLKIQSATYGGNLSNFSNGNYRITTTTAVNPTGGDGTMKITVLYRTLSI